MGTEEHKGSFGEEDELLEPTPIVPIEELGQGARRSRKQKGLLVWSMVGTLLLAQTALALYSGLRRRGRRAPASSVADKKEAAIPSAADRAASARDARRAELEKRLAETRAVAGLDGSGPSSADMETPIDGEVSPASAPSAREQSVEPKRARKAGRESARRRLSRPPRDAPIAASPADAARDVTVPPRVSGSASKGERIFRIGCGLCHGRTAKAIQPTQLSAKGWRLFFAAGSHGRHDRLRPHFTRGELADAKAYLMSASGGR